MPDSADVREPRRLAPGVEVFRLEGRPVLRTASGEFYDLRVEVGDDLRDLPAHAHAAFERQGLFASAALEAGPVAVVGTGLIAGALTELLSRAGFPVERVAAGDIRGRLASASRPATVSWCSDGLPPADWQDHCDATLLAGATWQCCSVEGAIAVLEPIAAAPGDVGHADVRGRRLAASQSPDHLAAYWAGEPVHTSPALGVVEAHLVAALLAADLIRCARGQGRTRLVRLVDLRTQTVSDHPVLPLPAFHQRTARP